jgi:hypothetical protein
VRKVIVEDSRPSKRPTAGSAAYATVLERAHRGEWSGDGADPALIELGTSPVKMVSSRQPTLRVL